MDLFKLASRCSQAANRYRVLVCYYGLERQLLIGEFDLAFEEIVLLRKHHKHPSFLAYSNAALLHSCILQKRRDRLEELYQTEELGILDNTGLMIAHHFGCDLSGNSLIHISPKIGGVNRRYMKIHSDLYSATLSEVLKERYGAPYFPFAGRYRINKLPTTFVREYIVSSRHQNSNSA